MNTHRCHIVEEFNKGVYDYIIATDEAPEIDIVGGQRRRGLKRKKDREYGVVRGIDFQGNSCFLFLVGTTAFILPLKIARC